MTGRGAGLLALLFVLAMHLSGCSGCGRKVPLAELAEKGGVVDRDTREATGQWAPADVEDEFHVGDGARTGAASRAVLLLSDRSKLLLEEKTLVRFLDRPPGSRQRFDLEMGEAMLEAASGETTLETDFGVAVIHQGGRLSVKKTDQGTRYEVSVGTARFEPKNAEPAVLGVGQGFLVGIGAAVIERYDSKQPEPPPSASAPPSAAPPPDETGAVTATANRAGATVKAPDAKAFTQLAAGESRIEAGSTVRLPNGVTVQVARGAQQATLRGAGEFVVGGGGGSFVVAESGTVALAGAGGDVKVTVPGGSIVASAGASADVKVLREETRVSVHAGTVAVEGAGGTEQLGAGQEATLGKKGSAAPEVIGRGPGYVDIAVGAGESFAIHDPSPPVAVGFDTGACPSGAMVELLGRARTRSAGSGTVSILVPAGSHKYQVRCMTETGPSPAPAASGTVAVLRDAGTARLPRTAPSTLVDADGRTYTVLYQNLLPKITVRWPNAPAGGPYTLTVASPGGGTQSVSAASATHAFAPGALREGAHRMTFQGGGAKSKTTTVDIQFDNATPTATLTSPANGSFGPGAAVTVSGIALEGWKISVGGQELPLDAQLRFSGQVSAPGGQRALAVRFVHPRRGVHYYLRRTSGN